MLTNDQKQSYFIKIAPDFGTLDIAEKYMLGSNKLGNDKLFFYSPYIPEHNLSVSNFRRGLFRISARYEPTITFQNGTKGIVLLESDEDYNKKYIVIGINNLMPVDIDISTNSNDVIGVGF